MRQRSTSSAETLEDTALALIMGSRVTTPLDRWIEHPAGISTAILYQSFCSAHQELSGRRPPIK